MADQIKPITIGGDCRIAVANLKEYGDDDAIEDADSVIAYLLLNEDDATADKVFEVELEWDVTQEQYIGIATAAQTAPLTPRLYWLLIVATYNTTSVFRRVKAVIAGYDV